VSVTPTYPARATDENPYALVRAMAEALERAEPISMIRTGTDG
jgi:hypothetical protein